MLSNSWRLISSFNWGDTSKRANAVAMAYQFRAPLVRTYTSSPGIPGKWRRAGYLSAMSNLGPGGYELANVVVPINRVKSFPMPVVTGFYQLIFQPVDYLPSLRLQVFEYAGPPLSEQLIKQLLLMN